MNNKKYLFWKIKHGKNISFLIGSMHLMTEDIYPLPDKFENAFSSSSIIVFEASMEETNADETKQHIQSVGLYPPGETIWDNISQKTKKKLLKKLSKMEIPLERAERIRPWLLSNMLKDKDSEDDNSNDRNDDVTKLQHAFGLDVYFFNKAKEEGKKIMFMESVKEHINSTANLSTKQQEFLLYEELQNIASKKEIPLREVIELWKKGDADALEYHYRKHHKKQMKIYQSIIINRNHRWLKKIDELLKLGDNIMFIVGGGHLGGPDGLVRLLTNKKYILKQE